MRTIDPELWYKKLKKPPIQVTRHMKFGQKTSNSIEICLRKSFMDAIGELRNNCSGAGFKYNRNMNIGRFGRCLHTTAFLLILAAGIAIISYDIASILRIPPIIVSQQATHNSINELHFPAIALCSNNIISKQSMNNYTRFLVKYDNRVKYAMHLPLRESNNIYNVSYIESQLKNLGALLTIRPPSFDPSFIHFLKRVEKEFNVTDLLFRLSTPCSSILHQCSWRGIVVPCASLFATRVTPLGFCCVFNSRYQIEDINTPPRVLDMVGQDFGLGIVIKEDQEDFAYLRRFIYGMEMLIFDGSVYPLLEDGSVRLYPMPRNSSLYVSVITRAQQVYTDALRYSETRRGCRVKSPEWRGFSWCLNECRRNTMVALCGCVPYTLKSPSMASDHQTCGLTDLACLYKHKEKITYLYPLGSTDPELSEELQDGLECPGCMFDCARLAYSAQISYSHYVSKRDIFQNYLSAGVQLVNGSVIRVFYDKEHQQRYAVETSVRSAELIARLCSIWILATGVSGIGALELLFYCTLRWLHHFIRRYNIANLRTTQE